MVGSVMAALKRGAGVIMDKGLLDTVVRVNRALVAGHRHRPCRWPNQKCECDQNGQHCVHPCEPAAAGGHECGSVPLISRSAG